MRIGTNINSLNAQRLLEASSRAIARSLERLASGKRISSARDDASGLGISISLDSQARGLRRVVENVNLGQSILLTAEGALREQLGLVQRLRELAVQASNGVLSSADRKQLQIEFSQLLEEFERISSTSRFNGNGLLNGDLSDISLQVGLNKGDTIDLSISNSSAAEVFTKNAWNSSFNPRSRNQIPYAYSTSQTNHSATPGDFNGDGILDVVVQAESYFDDGGSGQFDYQLQFWLGAGDGSFSLVKTSSASTLKAGVRDPIAIDINGDGNLDLVTGDGSTNDGSYFLGDGNGGFEGTSSTGLLGWANYADFNEDGRPDAIAWAATNQFGIFLNNGSGQFSESSTYVTGVFPISYATGDFNEDGHMDAIVNEIGGPTSLALGDGNGRFSSVTQFMDVGAPTDIQTGDLNGDGHLDLLYSTSNSNAVYRLGDGAGNFLSPVTTTLSTTISGAPLRIADFNDDGFDDFFVSESGNTLGVYLNQRDGTFARDARTNSAGATINYAYSGDFNQDGITDLMSFESSGANGKSFSIFTANPKTVTAADDLSILTQTEAQDSLAILDTGLRDLSERLSSIGSQQNRLEIAADHSLLTAENILQARSNIMDADLAEETASLIRLQILQQAQSSVLSQANINLRIALDLLKF